MAAMAWGSRIGHDYRPLACSNKHAQISARLTGAAHANMTLPTHTGRQLTCHMLLRVAPAFTASGALNPYAKMQGDNPYAVSMALVRASCNKHHQNDDDKHPAS